MNDQNLPAEIMSVKFATPLTPVEDKAQLLQNAGLGDLEKDHLQNAGVYGTTANVLGMTDLPVSVIAGENGISAAVVSFSGKTIDLTQLFDRLSPSVASRFPFDNARLLLDKDHKTVTFMGSLRMDDPVLAAFKSFLKLAEPPVLSFTISADGQDLSLKMRPARVEFNCMFPGVVELTPELSFSNGLFRIGMVKAPDKDEWNVSPLLSGTLTATHLASSPVAMQATVACRDEQLVISADTSVIKDLFHVTGLNVQSAGLSFSAGKETEIELKAVLNAGFGNLSLQGRMQPGFAGLIGRVDSFTADDVNRLYHSLTGNVVNVPSMPVSFEKVFIGVASAAGTIDGTALKPGIRIGCLINVADQQCEAEAEIGADGVLFEGEVKNMKCGPLTLEEAKLQFRFGTGAGKPTGLSILGRVTVENIQLAAKVAVEKLSSGWNYVMYAGLASETFRLSHLFPALAGSFPDSLVFSRAAVIYASEDGTTQDPDFGFQVKKGLQLKGILEEIPAISTLTGNKHVGLELTAFLGGDAGSGISIAMPESTRLQLGRGVTCDPFTIVVDITPVPSLSLVFGMEVMVAHQAQPLHFDFKLELDAAGASGSGTMKGYWKNPFGVNGVQVGPELALQANIIYAQFLSTGTPSGFGFAGGIKLGDIIGKMAMSIQEDPIKEILMGDVEHLSPANLVSFANMVANLNIPTDKVPDFFELKQLKLYCAPMGGSIGTINYPQGFSFVCDMVIFGKEMDVEATVSDNGVSVKGAVDELEFGPLKVTGERGSNAQLNLQLTKSAQSVLIDGAVELFGTHSGIFVDVSAAGIDFRVDQNFNEVLKYAIEGKSNGSIRDPKNLDFDLKVVFDNNITDYLRTTVKSRIDDARKSADKSIEGLKADLAIKQKAYEEVFKAAQQKVEKARADFDALSRQFQQQLASARDKVSGDINAAQDNVANARAAYDNAFKAAQDKVNSTRQDFGAKLQQAQGTLAAARQKADADIAAAKARVDAARNSYNQQFGSANNKLADAQRKVESLQQQINAAQRDYDSRSRFDPRRIKLGIEIAALEVAKKAAGLALSAAQGFLSTVQKGSEYVAFETAQKALDAANATARLGIDAAAKEVDNFKKAEEVALSAAESTLKSVQNGVEMTAFKAAQAALSAAESAGREALRIAQEAMDKVGSSAAGLALSAAENALNSIQQGSSGIAFTTAQAALSAAQAGADGVLWASAQVAEHAGDFIDIRHVDLEAKLSVAKKDGLFRANVEAALLGKPPVRWSLDLNPSNVSAFVEALFQKAIAEAKKLVGA